MTDSTTSLDELRLADRPIVALGPEGIMLATRSDG